MGLYFPGLIYFMLENTNNVTAGKYDAREHASIRAGDLGIWRDKGHKGLIGVALGWGCGFNS